MKQKIGRHAFNLFISIGSFPFVLDFPLYAIDIQIPLSKTDFVCLFGQTWDCDISSPYMWIYDEDILLCKLQKFWKYNYRIAADQFYQQFNDLQLKNICISYSKLEQEFKSLDGILYKYFHEFSESQTKEKGYKQISYYLDDLINRDYYTEQLFYYSKCLQIYPNLTNGSNIKLYGRVIIFDIPFDLSFNYYVI